MGNAVRAETTALPGSALPSVAATIAGLVTNATKTRWVALEKESSCPKTSQQAL